MVDRVIRIVIDGSGARTGLRQINTETNRVKQGLGGLKTAAVGLVSALGVRELAQYADTFTLINNKIRLVTDSQDELITVQKEVLSLANETRTGLESTAELYARVARSTDELGLSQREVLDVTKSVNQAIQISGASSAEASAAVIQFSQGLASGALRGDELRSVLEQTPRLARALAEGLGVGVGQLRELGKEGALTSEAVVGALQKVAPQLAAEFEQLSPTIQQSFEVMNNEALQFVGEVDQALGISAAFGRTIIGLSSSLRDITEDTILFGLALKTSISERIAEVASEIETIDERFDLFSNTLAGTFATIIGDEETAAMLAQQRITIDKELTNAEAEAEARLETIRAGLRENAKRDVITFLEGPKPVDLDAKGTRKDRGPSQDELDALEKADKAAQKYLETLQKQSVELKLTREEGEGAAEALRSIEIEQLALSGATGATVSALREANLELTKQEELTKTADLAKDRDEYIKSLQLEVELLQLTNEQREVQEALIEAGVEATSEQGMQITDLIGKIQELRDEQEDAFSFTETIAEQTSIAIRGTIKDAFTGDLDDIKSTFSDFLVDLGQELLTSLFLQLLTDTFTNLGKGGGAGASVFGALGQAFGGGTGRQFGGFVDAGQPFIGNEASGGPTEIFVPREAGRVEPLSGMSGRGGDTIIINEQDPSALVAALNTRTGAKIQRNFVTTDQRQLKRILGVR